MPSHHVPGQCLVCCDASVLQFSYKGVDADATASWSRCVPVVVVRVWTQQSIIRADVSLQPRVIRAGAVDHDTLRFNFLTCLVAVIISKKELPQIHSFTPYLGND